MHLHSTLFILILEKTLDKRFIYVTFTFYSIYINTITFKYYDRYIKVFTFYSIYINTSDNDASINRPKTFTFYSIYINT